MLKAAHQFPQGILALCYHRYHVSVMAQLLVRDIETAVVKQLRRRAAAAGVSVEEAHRRLLRSSLLGEDLGVASDFIAHLQAIPRGAAIDFPRRKDRPRHVALG